MLPVTTPAEMGAIDRGAADPVEVLIRRAGEAVAYEARDLLGGTYGRSVVVVAGKGNNGNDGRDAARRLARRGVRTIVVDAAEAPPVLPDADLVIDAAYGTGFSGTYRSPRPARPDTPVLAIDIPSGIDGLTGRPGGEPLVADRTICLTALKPGVLLEPGATCCGDVDVADIGLDVDRLPDGTPIRTHLLTADDVAAWWPERSAEDHKWRSAVWAVGGSPGMTGAVALTVAGAQRTGAGYVRWSTPGATVATTSGVAIEAVGAELAGTGWGAEVLADHLRFGALVLGNGLGRDPAQRADLRMVVGSAAVPTVVDADGLTLLGEQADEVVQPHTILTPHDGEFERLVGHGPGPDRIGDVRRLAERLGCVVLLKGPLTIVAGPDGRVLLTNTGDARLATAGTGDVLAGMVAACCARGLAPLEAAATAAFVHGRAAALGWTDGLVAGDVAALVPAALAGLAGAGDDPVPVP